MKNGNVRKLGLLEESPHGRERAIALLLFLCSAVATFGLLPALFPRSNAEVRPDRSTPVAIGEAYSIGAPPLEPIRHDYNIHDVRSAVREGVRWLAAHQFPEGVWDNRRYVLLCRDAVCPGQGSANLSTGVTALSLSALLHAYELDRGRTDVTELEDAIRRGLSWIMTVQDIDGCFAQTRDDRSIYGHAIATAVMAKAFVLLDDVEYRRAAIRGARFLEMSRTPDSGWGYAIRSSRCDTSVTGWAVQALLECRAAGIDIRPEALEGAKRWVERVTDTRYFDTAYDRAGRGQSFLKNTNDRFLPNEAMTATGLSLRRGIGEEDAATAIREGTARLARDLPVWNARGTSIDYYYWFHGTLAINALSENDGLRRRWNDAVTTILLTNQEKEHAACRKGSWGAVDKWSPIGGRVYAVAMNLLTLMKANF
ncbi:MAG: hypothetical protein A2Z34_09685 [Planctomycetes bacterium RBG_16_59_8]|nr:MAG: hypothetical protein A2Z34_09685 [Planctomycetes bacterium RBG_16_59_8]